MVPPKRAKQIHRIVFGQRTNICLLTAGYATSIIKITIKPAMISFKRDTADSSLSLKAPYL